MEFTAEDIWDNYQNMIYYMAHSYHPKLNKNSIYDFNDVVQEGFIGIMDRAKYYKPAKSSITTFVHLSLKSHYTNILKKENRNFGLRTDIQSMEDAVNMFDVLFIGPEWRQPVECCKFNRAIANLSPSARQVVDVLFDVPEELFIQLRRVRRVKEVNHIRGMHVIQLNRKALVEYLNISYSAMHKIGEEIKEKVYGEI